MHTDDFEPANQPATFQTLLQHEGHRLPTLAEALRWADEDRRQYVRHLIRAYVAAELAGPAPDEFEFRADWVPVDPPPWHDPPFTGDPKRCDEWSRKRYAQWAAHRSTYNIHNNNEIAEIHSAVEACRA